MILFSYFVIDDLPATLWQEWWQMYRHAFLMPIFFCYLVSFLLCHSFVDVVGNKSMEGTIVWLIKFCGLGPFLLEIIRTMAIANIINNSSYTDFIIVIQSDAEY